MVDVTHPVGSVGWAQTALNELGQKPPLNVDGVAGPLTKRAIEEFQKDNDCKVDGNVGPQTTAALIKELPLPKA